MLECIFLFIQHVLRSLRVRWSCCSRPYWENSFFMDLTLWEQTTNQTKKLTYCGSIGKLLTSVSLLCCPPVATKINWLSLNLFTYLLIYCGFCYYRFNHLIYTAQIILCTIFYCHTNTFSVQVIDVK